MYGLNTKINSCVSKVFIHICMHSFVIRHYFINEFYFEPCSYCASKTSDYNCPSIVLNLTIDFSSTLVYWMYIVLIYDLFFFKYV